jgi:hypothetical protein
MFDFVKFARDHPDISVNIEYWKHSPRGIIITLERFQPTIRRWRFCLDEELYFKNPYNLDVDSYISMWLNNGLKELNKKEGTNDQD